MACISFQGWAVSASLISMSSTNIGREQRTRTLFVHSALAAASSGQIQSPDRLLATIKAQPLLNYVSAVFVHVPMIQCRSARTLPSRSRKYPQVPAWLPS